MPPQKRVYMCRKCGQPKKGHVCSLGDSSDSDDDYIAPRGFRAPPPARAPARAPAPAPAPAPPAPAPASASAAGPVVASSSRDAAPASPPVVGAAAAAAATTLGAPEAATSVPASDPASTFEKLHDAHNKSDDARNKAQFDELAELEKTETAERDELLKKQLQRREQTKKRQLEENMVEKKRQREEVQQLLQQLGAKKQKMVASTLPPAFPNAYDTLMDKLELAYVSKAETLKKNFDSKSKTKVSPTDVVLFYDQNGNWSPMTDGAVTSLILDLHKNPSKHAKNANGNHFVSYNTNGYNYVTTRKSDGSLEQKNQSTSVTRRLQISQQSVTKTPKQHWKRLLYFDEWIKLEPEFIQSLIDAFDWAPAQIGQGELQGNKFDRFGYAPSSQLAMLATAFDAYATKKIFDETRSVLWCNNAKLHQFLVQIMHYGYTEFKLVMHGSGKYDHIRTDDVDPAKLNRGCAHGPGIYVSLSSHIAFDYQVYKGGSSGQKQVLLGLLVRTKHEHVHYSLGSASYPNDESPSPWHGSKDAICLPASVSSKWDEQLLWLGMVTV